MATEKRPRRQTGENRRRLLNAGMTEFGHHGFYGASTAAIASRADVPQPHLYANFASKQELFLACVDGAIAVATSTGGPTGLVPGVHVDVPRVLLQAFAVSGDPELSKPLSGSLRALRTTLGESALSQLLFRAATSLVDAVPLSRQAD